MKRDIRGAAVNRRERWSIAGTILAELDRAGGDLVALSRIARSANLSYARCQDYIVELRSQALILGEPPRLTPLGRSFLSEYRRWMAYLDAFEAGELVARNTTFSPARAEASD